MEGGLGAACPKRKRPAEAGRLKGCSVAEDYSPFNSRLIRSRTAWDGSLSS